MLNQKSQETEIIETQRETIRDLSNELFKKEVDLFVERFTVRMGAMFAATIAILGSLKFL